MTNTEVQTTGELAQAVADLAKRAVGPSGTVVRVSDEDAPLVRATFISRLAEAATRLANDEQLGETQ